MTDFSPLDSALYESTPEKIAASLRYLRKADAVMAALMPLSASTQAPPAAAVPDCLPQPGESEYVGDAGPVTDADFAEQPAAADEVAKHSTQDCYEHFLAYSGLEDSPWIKYAYFHGADVGLDRPSKPAPVAPAAAVPAANVTPMRQPRADLARLVESINAAVYANGDGLSVTEAIGALELAKLELLKEQEQ